VRQITKDRIKTGFVTVEAVGGAVATILGTATGIDWIAITGGGLILLCLYTVLIMVLE
jgi:hypothetical protein